MKTLIIYDNTGYIYLQITGTYIKPKGGLNFIEIEIPENKILKGVNTSITPNVPIFEDIPKTELELAQEQILSTQATLASLQEQILKLNGGM